MGAPQIIMIGLFAMNLYEAWLIDQENDFKDRELLAEAISITLWIALLFWGGFFG